MKNPLDIKTEIFKWGPTPFKLFYGDCFKGLFVDFPNTYSGYSWPKLLLLFNEKRMIWLNELSELHKEGSKLFLGEMLPRDKRELTREKWKISRNNLILAEENISKLDLKNLSNSDFLLLWSDFHKIIDTFWVYSTIPELSNYGSIDILKEKLSPLIPQEELMSVMEILTAPEQMSFYQEEEIDLVQTTDIKIHQKNYFWLKNSYANVEILPESFFIDRKNKISQNIKFEIDEYFNKIKLKKEDLNKKYNLSEDIIEVANTIVDGIVWQDTRKKDIWIYLHYKEILLNEVVRRFGFEKDKLLYLMSDEISMLMNGEKKSVDLNTREKCFGIFIQNKEITILDTEIALKYWDMYVDIKVDEKISEFKGVVASKGKGIIQGRIRIVLDPHNIEDFKDGDILVTSMTSPEYVFVMKKSTAVITDTGGLTSHAAIVSRELNIPCIVGTKIATKILKDGDLVEVDANNGIVRIIK